MAIRHSITLSTSEPNNEVGNLKIRQGDEQTQTLVANITENGVPKPFVGLQPFFCAKLGQTAGLGIIEQKVTGTMNPANGTLEYVMQPEDWQQLGRQTAYFSFRKMVNDHEWTEQFSTRDFNYNVIKSAFSEGLREVKKDGSTYVWTIEDMLRLFKEYMASGKTDWEEFVEQNREILESVDPGGKILGEIAEVSTQLAQTTTQLSTKRALNTFHRILNNQAAKIVCKGDSITYSVKPDASQVDLPYPKILQDRLSYIYDNATLTVLNKGVPGHNSTQGLATFQTDVIANSPNLVIIMYGANDSYQSMSLTTFKNNLTQMVRLSKENGIEVIICSPTPMMRVIAANPKQNIAAYSEVCKEVADSESVDFLDMYEEFSNLFLTNAINTSVFTDELHLTDFGYQLLADIVIKEKFTYSFKPKLSIGEYVGMHSPYVVTNLTTKYSSANQKLFYNLLLEKSAPNKYIKFLVYIDKPNLTMTILNVQASLSQSAIVYDFGIEYATLTLTKPAVLTYDIETDMPMTVGLHCFYISSNTVTTQFTPSGYFLKSS